MIHSSKPNIGPTANKFEKFKAEKDGLAIKDELEHFAQIGWEAMDKTDLEHHDYYHHNPDQYLYMHRHVIPELKTLGASEADIQTLFVDNPRRFLTGAA